MTHQSPSTIRQVKREPIAIIGIGCRFPGGVTNPETFWQLLCDEVDAIAEIPPTRIDVDAYYDSRPAMPGKMMTRWGGFLDQVDRFDAYFFGIAPREAQRLDPQQRLLLEVAWESLEDAGLVAGRLNGTKTGVFVGLWLSDYEARMFADPVATDFHMTLGSGRYSASGRISYNFGFQGPSMTIDTACSSSLVTVHLACQSLWSGECSLALAGGANVILQPHISIAYSQSRMMAPDGRCKFGDARADGYVRSEGGGMVVLKPLSQALANGDPIYAVIRGSGVNNDGRTSDNLATPGRQGQAALLHQVYQDAGISPKQVQYIEAHGTGTRAGDPVELGALGSVLADGRPPETPCFVGSVKTNFGHTESAAGIAGLIKVALMLKHRAIPANLHLQELNPNIPWSELGLVIPTELIAWPAGTDTAIAGVNSLGIAGTNAHVVVAEAPPSQSPNKEAQVRVGNAYLLPLSAHTPEALGALAQAYKAYLTTKNAPSLHDICYTASCRRSHHDHRLALVAESREEIGALLDAFLEGDALSPQKGIGQHKVVFVFPGQGSQWVGMCQEFLEREPIFWAMMKQCEEAMRPFVTWSLLEQLTIAEGSPAYRLNEIDVIQPTLLSIEISLAALWRSWGVEPDAVIGHSMGEVGAACVAGALSLKDAMRIICHRSQLLRQASGQGAMAVVELSIEEAQAVLSGYEDSLSIAVSNSPRSTVLSGDPATLDELLETLQGQDVYCRLVKVDVASHSPQMDPLKVELLAALEDLCPRTASVPIYSTALGAMIDGAGCDAAYWTDNLRQPVLFSKMVQQLLADEYEVFIEMSPHPVLLPAIQQGFQYASREGVVLPSLRRNEAEQATILNSLGSLYTYGYSIPWQNLYQNGGYHVHLPLYPWQRERFWYEPAETKARHVRQTRSGGSPFLNQYVRVATGNYLWEGVLSLGLFPYLNDHQVQGVAIFPAAAYIEMALAAAIEAFGPGSYSIEAITFKEALILPTKNEQAVQLVITPDMPGTHRFQIFSRPVEDNSLTWMLHASGIIRLEGEATSSLPTPVRIESYRARIQDATPGVNHYAAMNARGLQYGSSFKGIARLWRHNDSEVVVGELQLPEAVMTDMPAYILHPALLDACFQLLVTTLDNNNGLVASDTYLPVALESLQVYGRPDPNGGLWGYAFRQPEAETLIGDVFLLDGEGQVVATARGLRLQRLARDTQAEIDNWLYEIQWQLQPSLPQKLSEPDQSGAWLIFADDSDLTQKLVAHLNELGETCVLISPGTHYQNLGPGQYCLNPTRPDEFRRLLPDAVAEAGSICRGIVYLWGLLNDFPENATMAALETAQELGSISVIHLLQALNTIDVSPSPHLWLVTRGTHVVGAQTGSVTPVQSPLWGLGGVISYEHSELRCRRIDLNPRPDLGESKALLAELWADTVEDQVALRGNTRWAARLVRYQPEMLALEAEPTRKMAAPGQAYRLVMPHSGILDNLTLQAVERQHPGPGQVEIEVYTVGLNFIDVLKAMGIYPGLDPNAPIALGAECAGRVTAVGEGVDSLQVGDEVIAITPSFEKTSLFSAYVIVPAELTVLKPAHLTFEAAATIPITFLTTYYALYYLGRLDKEERVLIHSATGGVGLAAIQLAQLANATIFATAGSPEKRAYLHELGIQNTMDSRSLIFAEEVMAQTGGSGVDMVLNSLTGQAMAKSLAILGRYGRFLEIGKQDIYQNNQLGLEPFKKNLSFFAIDLARVIAERPSFVATLFREVMQYFEDNRLQPLPFKTFSISHIDDAFRCMAQAKHIGKIVVTLKDEQVMLTDSARKPAAIHADGTYLITGGFGGLGLAVAQWLAQEGARHLAFMGRRGPTEAAQAVLDQLKANEGTQVTVVQADVTETEAVAAAIRQIKDTMPPLRGIIHAAGILDDSTLLQLNQEQFKRVIGPKVHGAWNLHTLTQDLPLDFFILFSSVAALLGSPGQGNYVAGNAFLDALAHYRRTQGQPALSINWGPWSEVGLAATQANRGQRLAMSGVASITPEQGVATLARLFQQTATQIGVMPFNVQQWGETYPAAAKSPLFTQLREDQPQLQSEQKESGIRDALLAAEPGRQRRNLLESFLREQAAQVLRLTTARIPLNKPLKSLGFDSLMTLEFRNHLEASLGLTLSATLIWNYPTIDVLAPHLAEKMNIPLEVKLPQNDFNNETAPQITFPNKGQISADNLAEFTDLSEDEAAMLLAEELLEVNKILKGK